MARRLRTSRRCHGEQGLTIVELLIAALVMAVASAIFTGTLLSTQRTVKVQEERSRNNDQVRLAIEQLDREVRSGNLLYNPAAEPVADSLRVFSQSNGNHRCVQWLVRDGQLLRRTWAPSHGSMPVPSSVSGWQVVAERVVNASAQPPVPVFTLADPSGSVGRPLNVTILTGSSDGSVARVETSITGRNTTRGFRENACSPLPAGS
jgi:Tfp pilus assembly protein PilW